MISVRSVFRSAVAVSLGFLASGAIGGVALADGNDAAVASDSIVTYPASDYIEQAPGTPGGTLRISAASEPGTLDFQVSSSTPAKWLGRLIYDNLVYLDEKGNITPWLAKSWTISPDGKTYTFHLRDDVTFSDGTKFDAQAVLVNLRRMRDPATRASMTTAYIAPYVDGKVIDAYTFQANLREPYTPFLDVLAQSWLGMESPKEILENPKGLAETPIGTGPFTVESYTRSQSIRFVKRPDYNWSPPFVHHPGPAYLDRIEVDIVSEAMVRYASFVAGQYDFMLDAPPQNAAAIRADKSLVFSNRINLGNPFRGIAFNTTKPPFDNANLRKAVALSIDREGIAQLMGFGEYLPKTDYLSAITPYYDPSFKDVLRYDVAGANRLLDAEGWTGRDADGYRTKNGQRLSAELLIRDVGTPSALIVEIQSDAKKVGVELKLLQLPSAQLLARRNANDYQAMSDGIWHTNTPDGLYIVYHSKQISTATFSGQNSSHLQDPQLDDLLSRARQSRDPAVLKDLYSQAQKRLTELVPTVPLYENHTLVAYKSFVKGVIADTSHNTPFFTTVWLAPRGHS